MRFGGGYKAPSLYGKRILGARSHVVASHLSDDHNPPPPSRLSGVTPPASGSLPSQHVQIQPLTRPSQGAILSPPIGKSLALSDAAKSFEAQLPAHLQAQLSDYRNVMGSVSLSATDNLPASATDNAPAQLQTLRQTLKMIHAALDEYLANEFAQADNINALKQVVTLDKTAAVLLECTRSLEMTNVDLLANLRQAENWDALFAHLPTAVRKEAKQALLSLEDYVNEHSDLNPDCAKVLKTQFVDMIFDEDALNDLKDLLNYQPAFASQSLVHFRHGKGLGSDGLSVDPLLQTDEVDVDGDGPASRNLTTLKKADGLGRPLGTLFRVNIPRNYAQITDQLMGLYCNDKGKLTTTGQAALGIYHEILGHGLDIARGQLPTGSRNDAWTGEWEVTAIAKENTKRALMNLSPRGAHVGYRVALPLTRAPWCERTSPEFYKNISKQLLGQPLALDLPKDDFPSNLPLPTNMRRTITNTFAF